MFGALKRGRFRSLASLILVVNVVGKLQQKRTRAASRGFLAAARLSCIIIIVVADANGSHKNAINYPKHKVQKIFYTLDAILN